MSIYEQAGRAIRRRMDALGHSVVELQYAQNAALAERYGPEGVEKCIQDTKYHLAYLADALITESDVLFTDYVQWATSVLTSRNIPNQDLIENLRCLREVLVQELDDQLGGAVTMYIDEALQNMGVVPLLSPVQEAAAEDIRTLANAYVEALLQGENAKARHLVIEAVEAGTSIRDVYLHVFQWSQHEVGRLWQMNRITVAQEHFCTATTQRIMALLVTYFPDVQPVDKTFVMACVSSEQHDMGARMVADYFDMEGWRSYYLGANMPQRDIVSAVQNYGADVLGISATMTFHLKAVIKIIDAIRLHPDCQHIKILVGGYPFNVDPDIWRQIRADGYAHSADGAFRLAETLVA